MIIDFSFGNYKSFKDIQTLNMTAANIVSKDKVLDETNLISIAGLELLKNKAIYGPNASGKSNLVSALIAFIRIVNRSFKDDDTLDNIESFKLSEETTSKPSFFQLRFISDGKIYRYGFEADENRIHSEWLFEAKNSKSEKQLFIREGKKLEINDKHFKEGQKILLFTKDDNSEVLNDKVLLLSIGKALNGPISKLVENYISSITIITGLGAPQMKMQASQALKDEDVRKKIAEMLRIADTGISDVELFEITEDNVPKDAPLELLNMIKDGKKFADVVTSHPIYNSKNKKVDNVPFSLSRNESEGTKKMFELSIFIITSIEQGRPLFIDEFDARFHPELTRKLIELFNSKSNSTTQFVITTHDTNLLSSNFLRRDQIAFVDRDKFGCSKLYSLVDFKGVRNDASLEKDYNKGKFGAVPYIGNFESAIN